MYSSLIVFPLSALGKSLGSTLVATESKSDLKGLSSFFTAGADKVHLLPIEALDGKKQKGREGYIPSAIT